MGVEKKSKPAQTGLHSPKSQALPISLIKFAELLSLPVSSLWAA